MNSTHGVEVRHGFDLLVVVGAGQLSKAFWVEFAAVGEQLGPVLFGQLGTEGVDGDDEGSPVCLELQHRRKQQAVTPPPAPPALAPNC